MAADAATSLLASSNPYMAAANIGADVLKAATGGTSSAGGTSTSSFDSSGWNVNFGSGTVNSDRTQGTPMGGGAVASLNPYLPYVLVAAGLLVVWRMTRKA